MTQNPESPDARPPTIGLPRLFLRFLKFGLLAFGGPVAQIAMIRRELVEREGWMSSARFNRLLAVMQALPGPEAHELCVHMGIRARGRVGGVLAGLGFMLPGLMLMLGLAWLYFQIDVGLPWIAAMLLGVQAGVIGLVIRAVERIGRHVVTSSLLWIIAGVTLVASLLGVSFWLLLGAAGVGSALMAVGRPGLAIATVVVAMGLAVLIGLERTVEAIVASEVGAASTPGTASLALLFLAGLKAGLLTFGGAYTAIPLVREGAVGRGWMSDGQFLDGLALGSVLPAPLIIFTTFVGYVAGGPWGALAITAGTFLPAFAFSLIFYDRLEAVVEDRRLKAFLDGVAAGAVALIAGAAIELAAGLAGRPGPVWPLALIAVGALFIAWVWRSGLATLGVVIAAAMAGVAMQSWLG